MPPINNLIAQLSSDYPNIHIVFGEDFKWSQSQNKLTVTDQDTNADLQLLHELAHALLNHADFSLDIELLTQERQAWDLVRTSLAERYGVNLNEAVIEESLDTYRAWLYARSACPTCELTGLQTKTSTYVCPNCRCSWRPNDARRCALRRYKLTSA